MGSVRHRVVWLAGAGALLASGVIIAHSVDLDALGLAWRNALSSPPALLAVVALYGLAFLVRAAVWARVLPGLSLGHALAALHVSLLGNHLLPFRLGEALRVTTVVRRARLPLAAATASTVMLRATDVLAVVALAAALGPNLMVELVGVGAAGIVAGAAGLWILGLWWLKRLQVARSISMRTSAPVVAGAALVSWILESAVMYQAVRWAGFEIGIQEAILVTAITIAAQTVAIAPGGLGTYEAAATASLVALGSDAGPALAAALGAHALKTAYSLLFGTTALFVPAPSALGRVRLPIPAGPRSSPSPPVKPGPVVLFLPAHNEEEAVGDVVERVPSSVQGRAVHRLVIDDGSTDRTAERAAWAGAEVISLPCNQGLGAAVRRGLQEASRRGAAAVAFCDADGEYSPEELDSMVAPILAGDADYVIGSRFSGQIGRMLPHRRFGNKVLTVLLSVVARRRISDGQSGYRAFSAVAASDAEVIHDFNYAQVLTLDLLAKGYRYAEVPIRYSFRESGSSFVKLGRYLRHVIPAVHRELNKDEMGSVFNDVLGEPGARSSPRT